MEEPVPSQPASPWKKWRKKWRDEHRDSFNEAKKRNYASGKTNLSQEGQEWTSDELERITDPDRPTDRELAEELGRSLQAIQIRRSRLKREK